MLQAIIPSYQVSIQICLHFLHVRERANDVVRCQLAWVEHCVVHLVIVEVVEVALLLVFVPIEQAFLLLIEVL